VRSLEEISKNLLGNLKKEIPFKMTNILSHHHRDIHEGYSNIICQSTVTASKIELMQLDYITPCHGGTRGEYGNSSLGGRTGGQE
jgi:hypothetical protein